MSSGPLSDLQAELGRRFGIVLAAEPGGDDLQRAGDGLLLTNAADEVLRLLDGPAAQLPKHFPVGVGQRSVGFRTHGDDGGEFCAVFRGPDRLVYRRLPKGGAHGDPVACAHHITGFVPVFVSWSRQARCRCRSAARRGLSVGSAVFGRPRAADPFDEMMDFGGRKPRKAWAQHISCQREALPAWPSRENRHHRRQGPT